MKKAFQLTSLTFILCLSITILFSQGNRIANIPNRDPNDPVYNMVEKMPQLKGDKDQMKEYLKYYPYPICGIENKLQGKVVVQFIVEKSGSLTDIKVIKSPNDCLGNAALMYIKQWPAWDPAQVNNKPVSSLFTVPFDYNLEQYNNRPK